MYDVVHLGEWRIEISWPDDDSEYAALLHSIVFRWWNSQLAAPLDESGIRISVDYKLREDVPEGWDESSLWKSSKTGDEVELFLRQGVVCKANLNTLHAEVEIYPNRWLANGGDMLKDASQQVRLEYMRTSIMRVGLVSPFVLFAPQLGALMFHSSAVVVPDVGVVLFPGVSTAGKSTNARWAAELGWTVLADDMTIVQRRADGAFVVPASPFISDFRSEDVSISNTFPVAAVAFPVKDSTLHIERLSIHHATVRLLKACIQYRNDATAQEQSLTAAWELLSKVPAFEYRFPKEQSSILALHRAIAKTATV